MCNNVPNVQHFFGEFRCCTLGAPGVYYPSYIIYIIIWLFDVIVTTLFFKVDDVDTVSEHLPPQTTKRNSIFHQPGSEWNRGKRVSISYTTQQADMDSPHRPRKVRICIA